jgi:hypothetical protein
MRINFQEIIFNLENFVLQDEWENLQKEIMDVEEPEVFYKVAVSNHI